MCDDDRSVPSRHSLHENASAADIVAIARAAQILRDGSLIDIDQSFQQFSGSEIRFHTDANFTHPADFVGQPLAVRHYFHGGTGYHSAPPSAAMQTSSTLPYQRQTVSEHMITEYIGRNA